MKMLQIEQFLDFHCIADRCPYTCCQDWDIFVDADKVDAYMKWGYESDLQKAGEDYKIKLDASGKCPFLDENELCGLVIKHGEGALCRTCNIFPRLSECRGDILEYSLSNACPEVIRILRDVNGQLTFILDDMDREILFEKRYSEDYYLCRDMVIDLLQISDIPLWIRVYMAYKFSKSADIHSKEQVMNLLQQYNSVEYVMHLYNSLVEFSCDMSVKMQYSLDLLTNVLAGSKSWYGYDQYAKPILEKLPSIPLSEIVDAWERYKPHRAELDLLYENVLVNMVFQNGIGDNNDSFFHKEIIVMCMEYSSMVLLNFFYWLLSGEIIDERIENNIICYCAKELEHRTVNNLNRLLQTINGEELPNDGQIVLWVY